MLHVGPPKTGTTALQSALHTGRDALLAHGVRYAGRAQHSRRVAYAAIRRPEYPHLDQPPPERLWQAFVTDVREAPEARVIVSSEIFTDGDDDAMRRVVNDLGPHHVHVVLTLRALPRILASQWQQGLKGGLTPSLDDWLREIFDGDGPVARRFWRRHRHDRLVAHWSDVVGSENLTVVVVDDRDHGLILRAFEQLLDLRPDTLRGIQDRENRSMTLPEAETIRAFNVAFRGAGLRSRRAHRVRQAVVRRYLRSRRPSAAGQRIEAPPWALERTGGIAAEMVAAIRATEVNVIGDLDSLAATTGRASSTMTASAAVGERVSLPWRMRATLALLRATEPIAPRRRGRAT